MSYIYSEDYQKTLKRNLEYDYVFCVPPDYNELGMNPKTDESSYELFLNNLFSQLKPKKNIITVGITDRKFDRGIVPKHITIIENFKSLKYKYLSQKIWCKSFKANLYRLNYSFIMSFANGLYKQNNTKAFLQDVWEGNVYKHQGYNYAIALSVVKRCIENFTNPGDTVYDPFMGSGTTAVACKVLGRKYLGSEINKDYIKICKDRIQKYEDECISLIDILFK